MSRELEGNRVNLPISIYRNVDHPDKAPSISVLADDGSNITASGQIDPIVSSSFTRPSNTTAYIANQVINNAVSGATQQSFVNIAKANGTSGYIRFILATGNTTPTNRIRIHIYNAAPTTVKNDATTWALDYTNDASKYLGYIDLDPLLRGVAYSNSFLMYKCTQSSRTLFYELQTLDAFTPASGTGYSIKAISDQNNV